MLAKVARHIGIPRRLLLIALMVVALWTAAIVATGAHINVFPVTWDFTNSGAFGDSFGPLSAFMALIAALSAIAAYRSQAVEVSRLQKRQEQDDANRHSEQIKFQKRQAAIDRAAYKTGFEETFFKLIDTFRSIVSQTDIKTSDNQIKHAHDAFQSIVGYTDRSAQQFGGDFVRAWTDASNKYKNDLNHYFRFMYHVILFVHLSNMKNKYFYTRLLRALLSDSELILLGLNCEYGEGREKFRDLIENYSMLHNISQSARHRWFASTSIKLDAFDRN